MPMFSHFPMKFGAGNDMHVPILLSSDMRFPFRIQLINQQLYCGTTPCSMAYLMIMLSVLVWLLSGCDLEPKRSAAGGPVYVRPSVDSRGRVRKGYVRRSVSTNKGRPQPRRLLVLRNQQADLKNLTADNRQFLLV